jgi:NAD(P)-dependent dehydrogenase (short-subunit alcohol dehydrogenase family)
MKVILITGCSSGIGAALALEFQQRGHCVYATARKPESLAPLAAKGVHTLPLDVDDDDSVGRAMDVVRREQGHLDLLVNNAGYGQFGAMVDLDRAVLRRQFETNVIAPVAMVRAALPLLRAASDKGHACVANVGSISGIATTPFAGAYCASKAALHAISDALRMELSPFGIDVVTIQPGGVRSRFGDNTDAAVRLPDDSMYQPVADGIRARARASQKDATPADAFARQVAHALLAPRPPATVRLGHNSTKLILLRRLLPTRRFDAMLARKFGLDRLRRG